jgi:hypothetical protein
MKLFDYLRNKRLARIVLKSKNHGARWKAVKKITDEAVLKEIILSERFVLVCSLSDIRKRKKINRSPTGGHKKVK